MPLVPAAGNPPPLDAIEEAVRALAAGDIIGVPTDTVYGLAADALHSGASDRLFQLKGRPRRFEIPVLVAGLEQALGLSVALPECALTLMQRCWPGPLTIVVPRRVDLDAELGEEDATIGLRCPDHPVPLALCAAFGPMATTSANRHGQPPLTTAAEVVAAFGSAVEVVLDAGACVAMPSTVVDCTGGEPRLLRDGGLAWTEILAVCGLGPS